MNSFKIILKIFYIFVFSTLFFHFPLFHINVFLFFFLLRSTFSFSFFLIWALVKVVRNQSISPHLTIFVFAFVVVFRCFSIWESVLFVFVFCSLKV